MKLTDRIVSTEPRDDWDECCGFLSLNIDQYMFIQRNLMVEQMALWSKSGLGRRILKDKNPQTIEEFRSQVPLTTYADYADILLQKQVDQLPLPPVTWVETTWEGGKHPVKVAPYTQGIIDTFSRNGRAIVLMASATDWGEYTLGSRALSGLAPLPYLTGLMGLLTEQEFHFKFMPPRKTTETMGFTERSKLGFKMAMGSGVDYFLGLGSISHFLSKQLGKIASGGSGGGGSIPPSMAIRVVKARMKARKAGRDIMPKDLFDLKGFICAGTDNACYKDELEELWGVRPMELFAGTECSLVGTETWNRKDLYLFPDSCFYEFLPECFIRKDDKYMPTVTMDQVEPGQMYELVITVFKGGAFARYRTGDMYRCVGIGDKSDRSTLPRFRYIDRVPSIIDIAGFTRITKNSIEDIIEMSHLPIKHWIAAKQFDKETGHPFLHMYLEMDPLAMGRQAISEEVFRKHLEIYFNYLDSDYDSLKKILDMEPLQITFLRTGTFDAYTDRMGRTLDPVNPDPVQLSVLVAMQDDNTWEVRDCRDMR